MANISKFLSNLLQKNFENQWGNAGSRETSQSTIGSVNQSGSGNGDLWQSIVDSVSQWDSGVGQTSRSTIGNENPGRVEARNYSGNARENIPTKIGYALLGKPVQIVNPEASFNNAYPQNINDFVSNIKTQDWAQPLFNKQIGYTDNQLVERIGNGLNDGYKQIADFQARNNIKVPKTGEEIELANVREFNQYPQIKASMANGQRQGGFLRDLLSGAKENYNEDFSIDNWGQGKNIATRLGEGMGTIARFANSAPGRALISGGLVGVLGGSPAQMVAYGLSAGVGRQKNRLQDKLYRKQLEKQGIDISDIGGIIDKEIFDNIINMQNKNTNTIVEQQASENNVKKDEGLSQGQTEVKNEVNDKNETDAKKKEYNKDLLEFLEIMQGGDKKAEEFARKSFIKRYGKDPYELFKQQKRQ